MKKLGVLLSLVLLLVCFGPNAAADDSGPPGNHQEMVIDIGQPAINYSMPEIQMSVEYFTFTAGDFLNEGYAGKKEVEQILKYPFIQLQGNCNATEFYKKNSEFAKKDHYPRHLILTYFKEPVTKHRR